MNVLQDITKVTYNKNLTRNSSILMSKIGFLPKLQVSEHGGGVFVLGKYRSDKNNHYITPMF